MKTFLKEFGIVWILCVGIPLIIAVSATSLFALALFIFQG